MFCHCMSLDEDSGGVANSFITRCSVLSRGRAIRTDTSEGSQQAQLCDADARQVSFAACGMRIAVQYEPRRRNLVGSEPPLA